MKAKNKKINIGWEEWIELPLLKIPAIKAKIDTGAQTSSLHAFMVEKYNDDQGVSKVKFGIHPLPDRPEVEIFGEAELVAERNITSSNGVTELRYIIRTMAKFGKEAWPIDISLTSREGMNYHMLIGRNAMEDKLIVNPNHSCLLGNISESIYHSHKLINQKKVLSIGILSQSINNYTTSKIAQSAKSRGHEVTILKTSRCYIDISDDKYQIFYKGKPLENFDIIIPRIGLSVTGYGLAILRQFESQGVYSINSSIGISNTRDKLLANQLLSRGLISMPKTVFGNNTSEIESIIDSVGGVPFIIKVIGSTNTDESILVDSKSAAYAVFKTLRSLKAHFIAQEYIFTKESKHIRCIVLADQILGAVEWQSNQPEVMQNIHQSQGKKIKINTSEKKMALRAAKILGLKFAGIEMLRINKEDTRILSISASPSLEEMEVMTFTDMTQKLIEYVEDNARPILARRVVG